MIMYLLFDVLVSISVIFLQYIFSKRLSDVDMGKGLLIR